MKKLLGILLLLSVNCFGQTIVEDQFTTIHFKKHKTYVNKHGVSMLLNFDKMPYNQLGMGLNVAAHFNKCVVMIDFTYGFGSDSNNQNYTYHPNSGVYTINSMWNNSISLEQNSAYYNSYSYGAAFGYQVLDKSNKYHRTILTLFIGINTTVTNVNHQTYQIGHDNWGILNDWATNVKNNFSDEININPSIGGLLDLQSFSFLFSTGKNKLSFGIGTNIFEK